MEKPRVVVPVLVVAALVGVLLLVNRETVIDEPEVAVPVRVERISAQPPKRSLVIAGTTRSADTALLRFQVSGRVIEEAVSLGDQVKKGDVLARVYNPELEPLAQRAADNLASAKADAEQAQRDQTRVAKLFDQQAVTRQEWERALTQLTTANKRVAAAQAELSRAEQVSGELALVAPFAGAITEVLIDEGEVVAAGAPAMRLSNAANVELSLPVSDKVIRQISLGQKVAVKPSLDVSAESVEGTVIELSPFRERGALPEVKIALGARSIGPGVAVTAELQVDGEVGVSLPLRSVLMTGDDTVAVYTKSEGRAKLVPIRPLSISTLNVVVDQGVNAGDEVITEGIAQLYDGVKVALSEVGIELLPQVDVVETEVNTAGVDEETSNDSATVEEQASEPAL